MNATAFPSVEQPKSRPKAAPATAIAPRVDSRVLAKHLGVQHYRVLRLIRRYENDFTEFGSLELQRRYVLLNEDQTGLLIFLSPNTPQACDLKLRLIKTKGVGLFASLIRSAL